MSRMETKSKVSAVLKTVGLWFLSETVVILVLSVIPASTSVHDDGIAYTEWWAALIGIFAPVAVCLAYWRKEKQAWRKAPIVGNSINAQSISVTYQKENRPVEATPKRIKDRDAMEVIRLMESNFEERYQFAYNHLLNNADCQRMYEAAVKEFSQIELPLAAEVRFEQLCVEYKDKFDHPNPMAYVDALNGDAFEHYCANLLEKSGYGNVTVTPASGDHGVDVLAEKEGIRYAIQCKRYESDLGNAPIQEVHAGKSMYDCQIGVVMTNRHFTEGAKLLAQKTGTLLWDREKLVEMIGAAEER